MGVDGYNNGRSIECFVAALFYRWMDGCMYGCMYGWMDGWIHN